MQFRTDPFLLIFVPEASQITVWLRIDLKLKPAFFFLDMKPDILGKIMKFPREPAGIRFFHIINPHQKKHSLQVHTDNSDPYTAKLSQKSLHNSQNCKPAGLSPR